MQKFIFNCLFVLLICSYVLAEEPPPDGVQKEFYDSGKLYMERTYKNGKLNGPVKTYYENGILRHEATVKDGKDHGVSRSYYEDGTLQAEVTWMFGGMMRNKQYRINGSLWWDDDGKTRRYYYQNGKLSDVCHIRTSYCESFYEDGTTLKQKRIEDVVLNGSQKIYKPNGTLEFSINYINGKWDEKNEVTFPEQDGLRKLYFKSGKLADETFFKSGKMEGLSKQYYENGKLRDETNFKEGRPDGLYRHFNENGEILIEGNYKAGTRQGKWIKWYREYHKEGMCDDIFVDGTVPDKENTNKCNVHQTHIRF